MKNTGRRFSVSVVSSILLLLFPIAESLAQHSRGKARSSSGGSVRQSNHTSAQSRSNRAAAAQHNTAQHNTTPRSATPRSATPRSATSK